LRCAASAIDIAIELVRILLIVITRRPVPIVPVLIVLLIGLAGILLS
jgi:hypothetical protein